MTLRSLLMLSANYQQVELERVKITPIIPTDWVGVVTREAGAEESSGTYRTGAYQVFETGTFKPANCNMHGTR